MVDHRFTGSSGRLTDAGNWHTGKVPSVVGAVEPDRELLLKLRQLLDEIGKDSSTSNLEVMWQIRSHKCNQAEIPQAIFRVGDQLASIIYLEENRCWEVQLNGVETQFCGVWGFDEARKFIEQSRMIESGVGQDGN